MTLRMRWTLAALLAGAALAAPAQASEVSYWMWDGAQAPVYQKCADAFSAKNPNIRIKIKQDGWDNYWTGLTTGFVSGEAPDVFVNHVSRYPEFLANGVMEDLAPRIAKDKYDMSGFLPGLAQTWSKGDNQWGLPKDWDTVAVVYNAEMLEKAGLKAEDLKNLTWNPKDGGTWEKTIARLTIDKNGKRGDEAGFDKKNVAVYGYVSSPLSEFGQTEWSYLAASTGFKYVDKSWGSTYFIDDPRLAETFAWLKGLADKGYTPSAEQSGKLGGNALFSSGKGALATDGSWMIRWYMDNAKFKMSFAPIPAGPEGRKSMFNGLADSIWSGSKNKDEAWKWVQFLGTSECQSIVGKAGVVFPARPEAVAEAIGAHKASGLDVSAFTDLAKPETTFPFPITGHGSEIFPIMRKTIDEIMLGKTAPADGLKAANAKINGLF